ncbi:hypothetical protein SAMN04489834_2210 [Microterricola viridarii]|uniref:Uncharacterized protein n=1 Tax=Microterricola viridarii TaxID=412690 RepID=A0A1H1V9Q4_9MICO|nr:hypothetical protein SAMN04489834_2210 [Microterricola viridarii]
MQVRDILTALTGNRWIFALAALQLVAAAINGTGAGAYYFRYIVGDLGLQSIVFGAGILVLPSILLLPVLMKRVAISQTIMTGAVCGLIGSVINGFAGANVSILIVGELFTGLAFLPVSYLIAVLILDLVLIFVIMVSSGRFDRLILPQVHADLDARGPAAQGSAQGSEIELEATPHVMVGDPAGVDPNPSRDLLSVARSVRDDS